MSFLSWLGLASSTGPSTISASSLTPRISNLALLNGPATEMANVAQVFQSWQNEMDMSSRSIKDNDTQMIRNDVRRLNHCYTALATTSQKIATDGTRLSDMMIGLIDDIVSSGGQGVEGRIREIVKECDHLTKLAMSLQVEFAAFKETLQAFGNDLNNARGRLLQKARDHRWWKVCFGVLCVIFITATLASTLTIAAGGVGAMASTPGGVYAIAGFKISANAAVTGAGVLSAAFAGLAGYLTNEHLTQEQRLGKFIDFISNMDSELGIVKDHAVAMEKFWADMGNELYAVSTQSNRVVFNGTRGEARDMRDCQKQWEEVRAQFRAYVGSPGTTNERNRPNLSESRLADRITQIIPGSYSW